MSKSFKKINIGGITTATSDKLFKKQEHKKIRKKIKQMDLTEDFIFDDKIFGNPWNAPKDGKRFFDDNTLLRK